jgi:hypothetical protein
MVIESSTFLYDRRTIDRYGEPDSVGIIGFIFRKGEVRKFSNILVSMLVLPPIYSGIDQPMSLDGLCLTLHDHVREVQSTLTYREVLRGHATRAYRVQASKRPQAYGVLRRVGHATIELAEPEPENERKEQEGGIDKRHERPSICIDPIATPFLRMLGRIYLPYRRKGNHRKPPLMMVVNGMRVTKQASYMGPLTRDRNRLLYECSLFSPYLPS